MMKNCDDVLFLVKINDDEGSKFVFNLIVKKMNCSIYDIYDNNEIISTLCNIRKMKYSFVVFLYDYIAKKDFFSNFISNITKYKRFSCVSNYMATSHFPSVIGNKQFLKVDKNYKWFNKNNTMKLNNNYYRIDNNFFMLSQFATEEIKRFRNLNSEYAHYSVFIPTILQEKNKKFGYELFNFKKT